MNSRARTALTATISIACMVGGGAAMAAVSGASPHPSFVKTADTSTSDPSTTDPSTSTTDSSTTPTTIADTTTMPTDTTTVPTTDTTTAPSDTTTTTSVPCNHGQEVSEVAHNTPPGPGHGQAVSDAAHHKCNGVSDDSDGDSGSEPDGGKPAFAGTHAGSLTGHHHHGHGHGHG